MIFFQSSFPYYAIEMYTCLLSIHADISMAQVGFDFYNLLCLGDVMLEGSVILNRAS